MFCRNCGYKLSDEAVFCPSCGKEVDPFHSTQTQEPPRQSETHQYTYTNASFVDEADKNAKANKCLLLGIIAGGLAVIIGGLLGGIAALILASFAYKASEDYCKTYGIPSSGKAAIGHALAKMAFIVGPIQIALGIISLIFYSIISAIMDAFWSELFDELYNLSVLPLVSLFIR